MLKANVLMLHACSSLCALYNHAGGNAQCVQPDLTSPVLLGDQLTFSCSLAYRGRWAPTMRWSSSDGDVIASSDTGEAERTVVHAITVTATVELNGTTMHSHVFFADPLVPAPDAGDATNVPDYSFNWTSYVITVVCK